MSRSFIEGVLLFIISPVLSLIVSVSNVIRNEKSALYFIGAFFSVFGAYLPPTSDAYRYRKLYYVTTKYNIPWRALLVKEKDFLYPLLSSFFNSMGFSFEFFKFILLLICYSLYVWMFIDILKKNEKIIQYKTVFYFAIATLFFSVRLFTLAYGIRFGVASTIVVVALYSYYRGYYKLAIVLYLISITMHFSMLIFILISLLASFLKKIKISFPTKLTIIVFLLVFSSSAVGNVLLLVFPDNQLIEKNVNTYIEGYWGTQEMLRTISFGGMMFTVLRIFPVIPLGYIVLKGKDNNYINNLCFLLIIILCISVSSITLLLRYSNVTIALLFVTLLIGLKEDERSLILIKVAFFSFFIMFSSYAYTQRIALSKFLLQYNVIISPITLIDNSSYKDEWVKENIDLKGEFR